jgi:basic membrane protein A and related proteins
MRSPLFTLACLLAGSLSLLGCNLFVSSSDSRFSACLMTAAGPIDDRSFNEVTWRGVLAAAAELDIDARVIESRSAEDYPQNLARFAAQRCDLILALGVQTGPAVAEAAVLHPDRRYVLVDHALEPGRDNVLGLLFATEEAAYLAGYAAAAVSRTGSVGTFGGLDLPPVTAFMNGYAQGIQRFREQRGVDIRLLGWDSATQTGLFAGTFESQDEGRALGEALLETGADVILPVAGSVGLGTIEAIAARGDAYLVGVDTDWAELVPEAAGLLLTSVLKRMDLAVLEVIREAHAGGFEPGIRLGTLASGGVDLAPFPEPLLPLLGPTLPELEALRAAIVAGDIRVVP